MGGPKRTGELQRLIPEISQKVLIQQLRELEQDGLVKRIAYDQMPPKVEYHITEYGKTADKIVNVMCLWGQENIRRRKACGEEIALSEKGSS